MSGNAHRTRPRRKPCASDCIYCLYRPAEGKFRNRNGHRHNPAAGKKQKNKHR